MPANGSHECFPLSNGGVFVRRYLRGLGLSLHEQSCLLLSESLAVCERFRKLVRRLCILYSRNALGLSFNCRWPKTCASRISLGPCPPADSERCCPRTPQPSPFFSPPLFPALPLAYNGSVKSPRSTLPNVSLCYYATKLSFQAAYRRSSGSCRRSRSYLCLETRLEVRVAVFASVHHCFW